MLEVWHRNESCLTLNCGCLEPVTFCISKLSKVPHEVAFIAASYLCKCSKRVKCFLHVQSTFVNSTPTGPIKLIELSGRSN